MIKINAAHRLHAKEQEHKVLEACKWLTAYTNGSQGIASQYLTNKFVEKHLAPLYELVPRPKPVVGLFHLAPARHKVTLGTHFVIKGRPRVSSWTMFNTSKQWTDLSEEVGLDTVDYAYVVKAEQQLHPFTSPEWLASVQKAVKKLDIQDWSIDRFLGLYPKWQMECICDGSQSVRVKSVYAIVEDE